jgi:hypothetical protein
MDKYTAFQSHAAPLPVENVDTVLSDTYNGLKFFEQAYSLESKRI